MYRLPYTSHTSHHPSQTPSLNLLCYSKTDARFMQDGWKAVWSIPYVSVASFFPSLKQNFIAYCSSKVSDCIFEIHQLWQSGFSRVYSSCCCSCSFEPEILNIGQSSHKIYSNNIVNFQESTTTLNAHTKKVWKLIVWTTYIYIYIYIYTYIYDVDNMIIILENKHRLLLINKYTSTSFFLYQSIGLKLCNRNKMSAMPRITYYILSSE